MAIPLDLLKKTATDKLQSLAIEMMELGYTQKDLETRIAGALGLASDSPQVSIARMNFIGSLRAAGFIVSGGRRGGERYQILDWQQKEEIPDASRWTGASKFVLETFEKWPKVTLEHRRFIRTCLGTRPLDYEAHENCFGYLWCYELARDEGRIFTSEIPSSGSAVVIRRFPNYPRFRIFDLDLEPQFLLDLARFMSQASLTPVSILNVTDEKIAAMKELQSGLIVSKRKEAIYSTVAIANDPCPFLGRRSASIYRHNSKNTILQSDPLPADQEGVVHTWKTFLESRHRQLAITRDFVAINGGFEAISVAGYREGLAVSSYILDVLPNRPDIAADMMNKSLNYTVMPGGRTGTSDWQLVEVCKLLRSQGILYLQAGGYDGGGAGLPAHKAKFADHDFYSKTVYVPFPYLKRDILLWMIANKGK